MATTDILPFGTGTGANVMSQSAYAALSARSAGFSTGVAESQQLNKVWRQSSFVSAGLANWIVAQGVSVPDDGNITGFVTELTEALQNFIAPFISGVSGVPPGVVSPFGGDTAPAGWLECNGAAVSRTTYAALFAAVGTIHGAGDGSTTFNVPDLRGEFLRGWDHGRGVDAVRSAGSSQSGQNAAHTHTATAELSVTDGVVLNDTVGPAPTIVGDGGDYIRYSHPVTTGHTHTITVASSGGGEARPRNVAMMYCIKT